VLINDEGVRLGIFSFLKKMKQRQLIDALMAVNHCFFDCLLSTNYQSNQYLYERRLHKAKHRLMKRVLVWPSCLALQAAFLEVMQVRYRVSDFSEFEIARVELGALQQALGTCFMNLFKAGEGVAALEWLQAAMRQFEGINEHVLKVSARDPEVYTLFLIGLSHLRASLSHYQEIA
jgi:hypothetical protein